MIFALQGCRKVLGHHHKLFLFRLNKSIGGWEFKFLLILTANTALITCHVWNAPLFRQRMQNEMPSLNFTNFFLSRSKADHVKFHGFICRLTRLGCRCHQISAQWTIPYGWSILETKAAHTNHSSVAALKVSLIRACDKNLAETVRAACTQFKDRPCRVVTAKGGYSE